MMSHSNPGPDRLPCFFCLQSNSRKYLNSLELESDLCGNAEQAVSSFHEFSLRNLYRFLNLLHSDKEEKDFNDLKMSICEDCYRLNGEFNKLYNLLEETKLRLNWCVQRLQDIMIKTRNESETSFHFEQMDEDVDEEKILEIWRTHTLDRLKVHTGTSFPRIVLHAERPKRPSSSLSERISNKDKISRDADDDEMSTDMPVLGDEATEHETNIQHQPELHPQSSLLGQFNAEKFCSPDDVLHPILKEPQVFAEIKMTCDGKEKCPTLDEQESHPRRGPVRPPLLSKETEDSRKCNYCSYVCGIPLPGREQTMSNHKVKFHPEHYLFDKSEMNPASGFTPERFRKILTDIVFPKFVCRAERYASCSLCEASYKGSSMTQNVACVKRHLIFHHKLVLKEDVKVVSEDPLLNERLISSNSGKRERVPPKGYSSLCPYCNFKSTSSSGNTSASGSMVLHLMRFHPEHYLIDENDRAGGLWHVQFRSILTCLVYPSFISIAGHQRSCSLCGTIYKCSNAIKNLLMVKRHLIFHHKAELKESFKAVLEDPLLEEKLSNCNPNEEKKPEGSYTRTFMENCSSACETVHIVNSKTTPPLPLFPCQGDMIGPVLFL